MSSNDRDSGRRWSPRVTVAAVIRDEKGRHLLVEEAPQGKRVLNQPAGHLEPGESLVEAVIREVSEETCHDFSPAGLVGVYQWRVSAEGPTYLRFCFIGSAKAIQDCEYDPDIFDTHWLHPEELASGRWTLRSPMVMQCIRDAESGRSCPVGMLHALGSGSDD